MNMYRFKRMFANAVERIQNDVKWEHRIDVAKRQMHEMITNRVPEAWQAERRAAQGL